MNQHSLDERPDRQPSGQVPKVGYFADKPDGVVWLAFKEGHIGAFTFIYRKYFKVLFNYGRQFGLDAEAVQDLLQDFFIGLNESSTKLGNVANIKAYLLCSFRRKLLRHLGKKKHLVFGEYPSDAFQLDGNNGIRLIESQLNEVQKIYLEKALKSLTARQREAVFHFYYEDLSYTEVADVMGLLSVKAARNLVYSALDQLRGKDAQLPEWIFIFLIISSLSIFVRKIRFFPCRFEVGVPLCFQMDFIQ